HLLENTDLRRRETGTLFRGHRLAHVGEKRVQRRTAEGVDRRRALKQSRIAHPQHIADHCGSSAHRGTMCSRSARTRPIAACSTLLIPSIETCSEDSPRPAAWLTMTAIAA